MNQKRIYYEIILLLLKKNSYGREISKELKVPLTSIQRTISDLEKESIIEYKKIGKNKVYGIKKHLPAR
ncbi:MAG: ArsR family transcriptional regulator, partial [Nanoarchaeota archaeon]